MPRREETILGLSPSCLRLATVRGREITRLERIMLDPAQNEAAWSKDLRPLDAHLEILIRTLDLARGSRVTIVYHAPTVACELVSVAAAPAAAIQAAVLSLRESLAGDPSEWLTNCRTVHTDPGTSGQPPKVHVLAVAERRDNAEVLAAFAARAGLLVRRQIPAKSALLGSAVREVLAGASGGKMTVVAMSDQATIISSAEKGGLTFARCVDFGYSQLLEAIVRGSAGGNAEGGLTRESACGVLFGVGIPRRGQVIDLASGLKAEAVLPGMQSAIQRYVVETRQTLRFMLADGELARAAVHLSGPGAMIPGIAGVLMGQLDLPVERLSGGPDPLGPTIGAEDQRGDLAVLASDDEHLMAISPPSASLRRDHQRLSGMLKVGTAVAACLIGGDVLLGVRAGADIDDQQAALAPRIEANSARQGRIAQAARLSATAALAEELVLSTLGERPDWLASLSMLTRVAGDSIRLVEVSGSFPPEAKRHPVLMLKGIATPTASEGSLVQSSDSLAAFIDRLSKHPIIRSAQLVSTRSEETDNFKTFVVSVTLQSLSPAVPVEQASSMTAARLSSEERH